MASYKNCKYSQAAGQFEAFNAQQPGNTAAHYYLALCYHNLNQQAQARREYEWVIKNGSDPSLKANATAGMQLLSQYRMARQYASSNLSTRPQTANARASRLKILDFYADWCGPCRRMKPTIEAIESKYRGKVEIQRVDLDSPSNESLVRQYEVRAIPHLVILDQNGRLISTLHGLQPQSVVEATVAQALGQ